MANLKSKSIKELDTWNEKELRKLRIAIKNRLSSFEVSEKAKQLPENHPLFQKDSKDCEELLKDVLRAEKKLK